MGWQLKMICVKFCEERICKTYTNVCDADYSSPVLSQVDENFCFL